MQADSQPNAQGGRTCSRKTQEGRMTILAIDPGNEQSAFVLFDNGHITHMGKVANESLLADLRRECGCELSTAECIAIEMVASFGMPVGREVFDTVLWTGRFIEAADRPHTLVYRRDVKLHLCHSPRANDASIRQALIDRYGGKEKAIGRKAAQGPLYGIKADIWSALAIAITYSDTHSRKAAA
jgi:hypothetical protein